MTGTPGGAHEVLAYGDDGPSRRPRRAVAAAGVAGLVVGFLAGTRLDLGDPASQQVRPEAGAPTAEPSVGPMAAGVVRAVAGDRGTFEVTVFNTGGTDVTATVVSLPGWAAPLTRVRASTIAPRSWGSVRFSAPPDCLTWPADVRVVHLRIRTGDGTDNQIVPLSQPARVLREHHEERCNPPPTR